MDNPTLKERINMIQKNNIPHVVQPHNTLPHDNHIPIHYLDDIIPEVIIPNDSEGNPFTVRMTMGDDHKSYNFHKKWPEWDKALATADDAINVIEPKDLIPIFDSTMPSPSVETHAFYNPNTDMTHYFVLAARWLVERKQEELKMK